MKNSPFTKDAYVAAVRARVADEVGEAMKTSASSPHEGLSLIASVLQSEGARLERAAVAAALYERSPEATMRECLVQASRAIEEADKELEGST